MPSIHNKRYDLFSPSSRKHFKPIIPVARLTRSDIESRLQHSIDIKIKTNPYTVLNEQEQRHFHTIPTFQLFPDNPEIQPSSTATTANDNIDSNENENLSLRKVPKYSLYRPLPETETTPILTLDTAAYIQKRKEILDEQRNSQGTDRVQESTDQENLSLGTTQDVLQEVLSDSVLNTPVTPPSATIPQQQQQSTVTIPQRGTYLGLIPDHFIPIMATAMQQKGCDTLRRTVQTRDSLRMKINFEDMIGLLNHPMVALRDGYEETEDDKWSGSGKTLFLKQFIEYTQDEQLSLKIAIITYDMDMETILYDCIKNNLNLPCVRIGSILFDAWEREYGVIFSTIKSNDAMHEARIPNADLMIAFDIRLGPENTVFSKISNKRGPEPVPIVWLYTLGTVEQRAIAYFETHGKQENRSWEKEFHWSENNWWLEKQEYQNILFDENIWFTNVEDSVTYEAVKTLTEWAKNNFSGSYTFPAGMPTTGDTEESATVPSTAPATNTIPALSPLPLPLRISTTTSKDQVDPSQSNERQSSIPPSQTSSVQQVPEILLSRDAQETTPSDMDVSSLSEAGMDIDTETFEHIDLPESVKAQVKQCFQYPSLQLVFERTPDNSRHSSPTISNRQRHRNNRWRGESNTDGEEEEEDEVASFYSASEFVQDSKPMTMLVESESSIAAGNSISFKLNPLKEAYKKEYQEIISRIQSQYDQEMKSLKEKFEQQAYEKLQNGS
ncbi:hypothetical protein BDC45DRAFT_504511 [Circinella umbellata]|nr:hypothetical protein BDC45DRAFT_504511 [Circinella umbellata]